MDHVSFFELFCPKSTTDFYKATWKARRKITPYFDIKTRYNKFIDFAKEEEYILNDLQYISMKDHKRIWDIKRYESDYINN